MTTGQLIRQYRKERHLTQKELGEKCLMPDSQIRQYETGRIVPKLDTLQRIAAALNVDISELLPDMASAHSTSTAAAAPDAGTEELLLHYSRLNDTGRKKVIQYAADLEKNPDYKKA